jgi:hypothetical protein
VTIRARYGLDRVLLDAPGLIRLDLDFLGNDGVGDFSSPEADVRSRGSTGVRIEIDRPVKCLSIFLNPIISLALLIHAPG